MFSARLNKINAEVGLGGQSLLDDVFCTVVMWQFLEL